MCLTPDCENVYTKYEGNVGEQSLFSCESCGVQYCKICGENAHGEFTCEDAKNRKGAKKEEEKKSMELLRSIAKNCPACGTAIQKSGGCNHMVCFNCKIHFCWKCMQFKSKESKPVYDHMSQKHGGCFDR